MMKRKQVVALVCFSVMIGAAAAIAAEPVNPVCVIKTSMGEIFLELFAAQAPKTVQNFIDLAEGKKTTKTKRKNFYDNLIFHRVIKDFMIQGGCPKGDGSGGPGYRFEDEINAAGLGLDNIQAVSPEGKVHPYLMVRSREDYFRNIVMPLARQMGIGSQEAFQSRIKEIHQRVGRLTIKDCYENMGYRYDEKLYSSAPLRGVIAMANSGPNTNGSQFFINLVDTPWLTGKHTVFGKVVRGMDVVDHIGAVAVDRRSKPVQDVTILSIRLQK